MDTPSDLETARGNLLKKIGRNVLLYQELERHLKGIIRFQSVNLRMDQLPFETGEIGKDVGRFSLGMLARDFHEELLVEPAAEQEGAPESRDGHASLTLRFEIDSEAREASRESLAEVVRDRNQLIHHFLDSTNLDSASSCTLAAQTLDDQKQRLVLELNKYQSVAKSIAVQLSELKEFIDSDEGLALIKETIEINTQ